MRKVFIMFALLPLFVFGAGKPFKIMSYNIRHGATSDKGFDLTRCASVMAAENPRFIALQEVDMFTSRVANTNTCEVLAALVGEKINAPVRWTFAKAIKYGGGDYGVALLSKEKPLRVDEIRLGGNESRVLLMCEFDDCWIGVAHLPLGFIASKHMNLTPHKPSVALDDSDGAIASENIALAEKKAALAREFNRAAYDYMADVIKIEVLARSKTKPVFVTGDWNALPNSRLLTNFRRFMTVITPEDVPTFHGVITELPFTGKGKCIDYIAIDSAHKNMCDVITSRVVEERLVSDHAPVVAEVSMKDSPLK